MRAKADKLSVEQASRLLIAEKQPQVQFTKAEQIAIDDMHVAQQIDRGMELYLKLHGDKAKPAKITLVKRDAKALRLS